MGEVITPVAWGAEAAARHRKSEDDRQRAADARAARQKALLDLKTSRLSKEERRKIARNLGRIVEDVAKANGMSEQQTLRDLFDKHDPELIAKRRRLILLKDEVLPREALVASLPQYRSLAKALAGLHPRAGLGKASLEQRFQERLVSGTSLSINSALDGSTIDVDAIGNAIDLLGDAIKLLQLRVPRLIEHFETLANNRLTPQVKSLEFGGETPPSLTAINPWGHDNDTSGYDEGTLTLSGPDEAYCLSEDERHIEHHWPSTKLGTIRITQAVAALFEGQPELAVIAAAFRNHPDWPQQSTADRVDLDFERYGADPIWRAENGQGHLIDTDALREPLVALSIALELQATNATRSLRERVFIERRISLFLCVYPVRTAGRTDWLFGLYLSEAEVPKLVGWRGGEPLFDASPGWDSGGSVNVALASSQSGFTAVRASDVRALDDCIGALEHWGRGNNFDTNVAPLESATATQWLGGCTLDWAMGDGPRTDRFKLGPVIVFEPSFTVPSVPASAPPATPAGMIERSILHDPSGDDVLSRVIQDAEARIAWLDELQSSWAEMHREARAAFAAKIEAISSGDDRDLQSDE